MSIINPTLDVSPDLGPAVDYGTEPTETSFDRDTFTDIDPFEPNGVCQGCGDAGWATWTDRTEGPCPACQGEDERQTSL